MWIKELTIKKFRVFQDTLTLELNKYLTCISGQNGVGKSTILAILSNVGEVKVDVGRHLNGQAFKGEFAE